MTIYFNKEQDCQKRKFLRNNVPFCERLVWHYLKNKKLGYRFRRQFGIDRYVVDFYCPKLRLAIEIDGPTHELDKDKHRQANIESLGIKVVRFTNDQVVSNISIVVEEIGKKLLPDKTPFRRVRLVPPSKGGKCLASPLTKGRLRGVMKLSPSV